MIKLIIKGFLIGLGKIIPGVSGSALAVTLDIYEKAIDKINNFFKNVKYNSFYLGSLGIGILLAILLGSKIIIFFINNFKYNVFALIVGLIVGTTPKMIKKIKISNFYDLCIILLPFLLIILEKFKINVSFENEFCYIILGFVEAVTTIIPGISSTAIYMMFNIYDKFLNIFSNIISLSFFLFMIGSFIGIILTSKLIGYFLNKYYQKTFLFITSFTIFSIAILIINYFKMTFINAILLIIGFLLSYILDR